MLAITLPFSVLILSFTLPSNVLDHRLLFVNETLCTSIVSKLFPFSSFWYGVFGIIAHEFIIYPLIRNRLPSILKRIGAASLLVTLISFISFILKLAQFLSHSSEVAIEWIVQILYQLTRGILSQYILTLILEFMCAQSPYNMRGLLLSLVTFLISGGGQMIFGFYFATIIDICTQSWCALVSYSVQLVLLGINNCLHYIFLLTITS